MRLLPLLALVFSTTFAFGDWHHAVAHTLATDRQPTLSKERSAVLAVAQRSIARLSEGGTVPENALARALEQKQALMEAQGNTIALSPATWAYFGPGNIGGRIRAIIVHPTNTNVMWLGSVGGGIWKTTNSGGTWRAIDDFLPALGIGCMAIDPLNPDVLYAGTGEGFFETEDGSSNTAALRGAGIYKSVDAGETWQQLTSTIGPDFYNVTRLAVDPAQTSVIVAATTSGIYRSTDAGSTWSKRLDGHVYDVKANPNNRDEMVAGVHDSPGVFWSNDGGATWTAATGISGFHRCEVAWSKSSPGTVYAGASTTGERILVYRSTNSGRTWTRQTSGNGISTYEAYNSVIWVDPTNANNLVVGGVYVYRSTNAGVTLTQAFNNMHPDFHVLTQDPNFDGVNNRRLYFGHDGGISVATNYAGTAYTDLNNNLGITQFYGVAVNDASGVIVAGAQDNGTQRYTGNINGWSDRIGGDGIFCASDPTDPNTFYGGYYYNRIFRSSNAGSSFSDISSGITDRDAATNSNFIAYFTLDPNNPNRMLACGRSLWRSNSVKGTPNWAAIKAPIAAGPEPVFRDRANAHMNPNPPYLISTCTIAKGNSDVVWVGHNNGQLYKTTNGTQTSPTWTRMDTNGTLPGRWVGRIVIDPNDVNRVYVAYMGWEADNVWKTLDGGQTWTPAVGTGARRLPSAPVSAFAVDPLRAGRLFAGTDIGVFTSWDDGQTWSVSTQGPGTVAIDELVWRNSTTLMAATHGRGIWQAVVTPSVTQATPASFNLVRGFLLGGGLAELGASDDTYLTVRRGIVVNQNESPINVEFAATAPQTVAQSIEVTVEAAVSTNGLRQTIQAFDFDASAWVDVDSRNASTTDLVTTVQLPGSVSRFIGPNDRAVRLRVAFKQNGPVAQANWQARFDLVRWAVSE
ncbi:MAG: hypothetical protein KIT11_08660 [Fimbriimonadaceae bacterium]|nr:hypothetical protein [Fimbriimonadaceae bacterium]QYK56423.1 MAG: hypothetical protein KF733_02855 [Fimbriimonadaceae bacterium]